jgi:hypothetical protein
MRHLLRLSFALAILLTVGAANSAADTITFDNSSLHPDGSFTIGSTVSLSNGVIDAVARILPVGGFAITGSCDGSFGCLNLTTGAFVGSLPATTANDYAYAGGGSVTVTGGIASLGLPNSTVLYTGSFDAGTNVVLTFDDDCVSTPAQCTGGLAGTFSIGFINPVLAAALGVNPNSMSGNGQSLFVGFSGISMPASGLPPSGTAEGNTNQLQVVTPAVTTTVPEPGSMFLLGSGLLMLARFVRRGR